MIALAFSVLAAAASGDVDLSTATAAELDAVEGVSTEAAEAIVAHRATHRIASVEQLRILPALDAAGLDSLRAHGTIPIQAAMTGGRSFENPTDVLSEFRGEPSVQDVQRWAESYAHTSPELVDRWLRQSRLFGALPDRALIKAQNSSDYDIGYKYNPTDGLVDGSGEPMYDYLTDAGKGQDLTISGELRWKLSSLVMSSERIRVISEVQDVVKLRDKVLDEVTTTYFERRRLQVEMLLNPKADLRGQVIDELRLMELTANVDALTGGQFSANAK